MSVRVQHKQQLVGKNIALSGLGYWPRPIENQRLKRWLIRWFLKTMATVLLLTLCNLVETARIQAVKEIGKTAQEVLIDQQLMQAFPVNLK